MSETETLFAALRQSSDEAVVDMLERMVRDAPDHALNKMNALDLAGMEGIDEERVIAALLNAVGLGMFEMTWSVMCPSCAGVLSANKSLKTLDRTQYNCAFCAAGYETTLDNLVEVTFTVSPRVRKIAAHNPDELSAPEYYRQIFWSSAIDLPDDLEKLLDEVTLEAHHMPVGLLVDLALGQTEAVDVALHERKCLVLRAAGQTLVEAGREVIDADLPPGGMPGRGEAVAERAGCAAQHMGEPENASGPVRDDLPSQLVAAPPEDEQSRRVDLDHGAGTEVGLRVRLDVFKREPDRRARLQNGVEPRREPVGLLGRVGDGPPDLLRWMSEPPLQVQHRPAVGGCQGRHAHVSSSVRGIRHHAEDVRHHVEMPFQRIEVAVPEPAVRGQPGVDLRQRLRAQPVPPALGVLADLDQPRLAEHLEMLRHRRLGQGEPLDQVADGALAVSEQVEDLAPARLRENFER